MRKHFSLSLALLLAVPTLTSMALIPSAHAQEQTPGFQLPQIITPDDVSDLSVDFDEAFNAVPNDYLSNSMKLNYQISLLEKMVERQAALQKAGESFSKLGITFNEPAPARGICAQLPANGPCLKAYPELYGDVVASRKAYYAELEAQAAAASGGKGSSSTAESAEAKAQREKEEAERKEREARKEREGRYRWTNISCVIGQCHGVLVTAANDGFRATVRKGTRLPDNTLVQDVSSNGIRVSIDGDSIALRPLAADETPAAGNAASGTEGAGNMDVLTPSGLQMNGAANNTYTEPSPVTAAPRNSATSIAKTADSTPAKADVVSLPGRPTVDLDTQRTSTPAGQTSAEPALGPSGLF